jgi:hypothetical protein
VYDSSPILNVCSQAVGRGWDGTADRGDRWRRRGHRRHGKEIPDFQRLFLATKEAYAHQGIDIHYETRVVSFNTSAKTVSVEGEGDVPYDKLIVCTGFNYAPTGVPGADLGGLYYVKNIRQARDWDKVLDKPGPRSWWRRRRWDRRW